MFALNRITRDRRDCRRGSPQPRDVVRPADVAMAPHRGAHRVAAPVDVTLVRRVSVLAQARSAPRLVLCSGRWVRRPGIRSDQWVPREDGNDPPVHRDTTCAMSVPDGDPPVRRTPALHRLQNARFRRLSAGVAPVRRADRHRAGFRPEPD